MVLLAMSSLLSERGSINEAIEKLEKVQDLTHSYLGIRVAALEGLIGLHLEMGQDDTSSVLADKCLQLLQRNGPENGDRDESGVLETRAKAVKGLVQLVLGNIESAEPYFSGFQEDKGCSGNVALPYGELLHATGNFPLAKQFYEKAIQGVSEIDGPFALEASNMQSEEVLIGATCALGQLEAHVGNFANAEEILTRALTKAEQHFGSHHPKVGVILTSIALMFRKKAKMEHSSSILIQEGLYRRAIDLLKAPPIETEDAEVKVDRRDITALARGGYAETLCVQQNRKGEGEKMKKWAETTWKNSRLSLAEALELCDHSSKVPVIDARISRVL
ncbi:PREDICTED: uncharacterized protein LOC104597137 [Nelumbo nucifera]|uniref:Uncharacterized protein LOC104597137 n=1 Tax=Nelumbo nucifera TaxID=4432 RepID=A0A1U7ZTF7_NELNU|nr:PREDICTED: uncharacterized protein LOC104597137 [Nelumbo nucifera]